VLVALQRQAAMIVVAQFAAMLTDDRHERDVPAA
jgi:hypothetical protein